MLQELARYTASAGWPIASMLFFIVVFAVVAVRVTRARAEDLQPHADLVFEGDLATPHPIRLSAARDASERRERATRTERAGEAARERACRGVRGAKPLGSNNG